MDYKRLVELYWIEESILFLRTEYGVPHNVGREHQAINIVIPLASCRVANCVATTIPDVSLDCTKYYYIFRSGSGIALLIQWFGSRQALLALHTPYGSYNPIDQRCWGAAGTASFLLPAGTRQDLCAGAYRQASRICARGRVQAPQFCAGSCTTNGRNGGQRVVTCPDSPTGRQDLAARRRPRSREHETEAGRHEGAVAFAWLLARVAWWMIAPPSA